MTAAWFLGASDPVSQNEGAARSTVEPIRQDNTSTELQAAPEWNQLDTDESGELVGLSPRMVGSDTHDSVKYSPWWTRLASAAHNILIDEKIASVGTAAQREEAGQTGHGTMQYAIGIEPVLREGAAMGNDYFVTAPKDIQEGAGRFMTPPDSDNWGMQVSQARTNKASRKAYQDSLYRSLLTG